MSTSRYRSKVDSMPTFEEYAAEREAEWLEEHKDDEKEVESKEQRMLNYQLEYGMELAARQKRAEAAEDEAARLTREYNEKMAALGVKHKIEHSSNENAMLDMLSSIFE